MYENHSQGDIPTNKDESKGCQAYVGNGQKCGEVKTLEILKEFQQMYESKVNAIKDNCSCTSTRLKIQMLEDWVKDLTEQNTMLVQVVEELEQEASERVDLLEEKLRQSSKTSFEIMKTLQAYDAQSITSQSDALQRLLYFQSDVNNLTEFIRRIREEGVWNTEGLHFYSVAQDDLCEMSPKNAGNVGQLKELEDSLIKLKMELAKSKKRQDEYELETRRKELLIKEQNEQIEKLNEVVERCTSSMPDRQKLLEELHDVRTHLKAKNEDYNRLELFDLDAKEKNEEEMKNKINQLQEENENLHKTISLANEELNVLHELIGKYYKQEESDDKNLIICKRLKRVKNRLSEEIYNSREKSEHIELFGVKESLSYIEKYCGELLAIARENKEQNETVTNLKNKMNISSSDMLVLHEAANKNTFLSESENDFHKTISILKADISKMILWKSENELSELKNHVSSIESTLHDIQSKDKLIKTKDEMIAIQNDTLNVAQKELNELREQLADLEKDRDSKIQEIQNLQQALRINQNTIEELKKALKNSDDKANNIQQTDRVQKIISANVLLEEDINYMKEEMTNLSSELRILQGLLKMSNSSSTLEEHNLSLSKSVTILQEHSEALVDQLKLSQKQITRELKLNETNFSKITELQKLLTKKSEELQETRTQLDITLRQSKEYENKIKMMEQRINEYKKMQDLSEHKTDEMVFTCNSDLICLKQKIEILNKILNEKSNEILRLHAELSIKSDKISSLVKENEITIDDNKQLTQNALNLEDQLEMYKVRCEDINDKYHKCKTELENIKKWGDSVHDKYRQEKKHLIEKLESYQKEESKLSTKLKESVEQLQKTKLNLKQKDEEVKNLTSAQEEILSLKEEINKLTKQRSRIMSENQKLQEQIDNLNISSTQFENRNLIISQQLDKCLEELNTLQCAKDKLEERNIQLETEVEHLQRAFTELNQEIRYKTESCMNLELELTETKCSRDEICAESRIVVSNVRSWLEEQKRINVALNETIKEKNLIIEELTMEKDLLMKNIKDVCERYEALTEELHMCKQYMSETNEKRSKMRLKSSTPLQRSIYTWGSQNSAGESRTSSPLFIEDHHLDDSYDDDGEPNPAKWMRKVHDMSEDILKSKKYWQTKMSKSKKIKPVEESKTSIAKTT